MGGSTGSRERGSKLKCPRNSFFERSLLRFRRAENYEIHQSGSRFRFEVQSSEPAPNYLKPVHEDFSIITPYQIWIDRAHLPADTRGHRLRIHPDDIFLDLDKEMMKIPGTIETYTGRAELIHRVREQEDKTRARKPSESVTASYLLRRYDSVEASIIKQDFLPDEQHTAGCSWIVIRASYPGLPGSAIPEISAIAKKYDLTEWRTRPSGL